MQKRFNYLSPDGFDIFMDDYATEEEANAALDLWVTQYVRQGYYSSNSGRIPLADLPDLCTLTTYEPDEPGDTFPPEPF